MILVTGGTGLLGGHVLFELLQKHERVAALRRPAAKTDTLREIFSYYTRDIDSLMDRIDWREGDLSDRESLIRSMAGISCVVNCAAIVSFDPSDRNRMIANNVEGARNLAMALPDKDTWLIQISSTSALGDGPGDDPTFLTDENTPRDSGRRHSGYSVSKFESEQALLELGVKTVFLNPGIILGPGQWGKGSSLLFANAWKGMRYYPYGGTGYVDVRDVAAIINEIAGRVSGTAGHDETFFQQRFCLVGANLRYRDFFNLAANEFGKPNPDIFAGRFLTGLAWRADGLRSRLKGTSPVLTRETAESAQRISFYSSGKIRKTLSFQFRPIDETIAWVADCFKKGTH